jgi:hypothetical protein
MPNSQIDQLVSLANRQVGRPYVWATAGPNTFDCSGLVYWLVGQVTGTSLAPEYRSSYYQWQHLGTRVPKDQRIKAGDVLFYDTEENGTAGHVGVYIGDGHMVNAINPDEDVVVSNINKPYWTDRYIGARRLFSGGATTPTGQPNSPDTNDPGPPTTPNALETASPSVLSSTPFRSIGDVPLQTWRNAWAGKPLPANEVDAAYTAAQGYTALALTQAIKESSLGTTGGSTQKKNPLGLMLPDGSTLQTFATWPLAFAEFRRRLTDPSYKGKPGPYFPKSVGGMVAGWDMSLLAYLVTYVGGPRCLETQGRECANGERYDPSFPKDGIGPNGVLVADDDRAPSINRYAAQTLRRLRDFLGIGGTPPPSPPPPTPVGDWQRVTFAGSSAVAYLPKNVVFQIKLTPIGPNRPARAIQLTGTTQHETGNTRPGTGAVMHSTWQDNGTPGHPNGKIGVHFYVDDDLIIQKIPVSETSIHSGDSRNGTHLSIERCVNTDQTPFADSEKNSAYLQAALLKYVVGKSALEAMYPHYSPPGQGSCPVNIGYHWSDYEARVDAIISQLP